MPQIKDLMTSDTQIVRPDATINEAAREMKSRDIGALPVVENDKVIGMLTDRDIAVRVVAEGSDPKNISVRQVMTHDVETVFEDAQISEVTQLMKEKQIRRVVVLDHDNRLTGICSLVDLAMSMDEATAGDVLRGMSSKSRKK